MMMDSWYPPLINLVCLVIGAGLVFGAVWFGYWMGRNSRELPVRSTANPTCRRAVANPIPEPDGDVYAEAMRSPQGEDDRLPTVKEDG